MRNVLHIALVLSLSQAFCARGVGISTSDAEFFEKSIRPLLADECYKCHSTAAQKVKGGLLLDSRAGVLKGGDTGPSIVPGNPDKSLLITAVRYGDTEMQMPPKHQLLPEQIKLLEVWVKMGAPDPRDSAITKSVPAYDYSKAKQFWSFQPIIDPPVPQVVEGAVAIDQFVAAKQRDAGVTPVGMADRRTLMRRVTYDLTGLPPTPDEVNTFVTDTSPNAWEKVVDRLLASPAYGEKWGRHWLDLVRYADTSGCNSDYPIPTAYKYRNYVIDSFNHDKPYNQFLTEQLAGDLLPYKSDDEHFEHIIATGYLAISRRFGSRAAEFNLTIDDAIDNVGKSMLGLSLGCARCHDHKFDPVPASDYYGLYGILNSTKFAFPGTEIYQHAKDFTPLVADDVAEEFHDREAEQSQLDDRYERLVQERKPLEIAAKDAAKARAAGKPLAKPPTDLLLALSRRVSTPGLVVLVHRASLPVPRTLAEVKADMNDIKDRLKQLDAKPMLVEKAYAVFDGKGANVRIQRKGDPQNPGDEAPRGFLQVLGGQKLPPEEHGSGRKELAGWIGDAKNPLTARVMVNRIWQGHFGKGIVQTPNDFGARGKAPTHPELLDYLATRFIQSGWSIKSMHKLMLMTQSYQRASEDENAEHMSLCSNVDVNNDSLCHFNRRRMEAEEVRDSLLALGGTLVEGEAGPHPFPPEVEYHYTQHKPFVAVYETNHRSVYLMQQRIKRHPFLEVFDGADTNAVTAGRARETSPVQALFFMNDPLAHDTADQFAVRVALACTDEEKRIDYAFQLCLSRPASSEELFAAHEYLRDMKEKLQAAGVAWERQPRMALASYLRVMMGSNEFFYVE